MRGTLKSIGLAGSLICAAAFLPLSVHAEPVHGFAAETSAATVLLCAAQIGLPVSTTHTITSSILGVGSTKRLSAVRWGIAGNIVWAWIFTIPGSAFVAAVSWWFAQHFF